jgi:excisionase family DNA binding protein
MYTENTYKTRSYTVKEVSQLLSVNEDTVRRMIKDGRLDGEIVKARYLITEASIKRLVKEGNKNK